MLGSTAQEVHVKDLCALLAAEVLQFPAPDARLQVFTASGLCSPCLLVVDPRGGIRLSYGEAQPCLEDLQCISPDIHTHEDKVRR